MSDTCPTVMVKADNEDGFMIINESDFDTDVHELFKDAPTLAEGLASLSDEDLAAEAEKHGIKIGNMKPETIITKIVEASKAE